jgi:membrane protein DedA with SNARE-associated domain
MEELAAAAIGFVRDHREWAFWIALLFGAAETIAIVSVLIPSTAILVGVGAIVATGALDFGPVWAGAAIGALIGSCLSFWLGHAYGELLLRVWPLSRHPEFVDRSRAIFARRGALAVTIGHFITFLRPVVFLMAGAARMPVPVFLLANVAGAVAWAWLIPKSGEVGGDVLGWLWRTFAGG